VSNDHHYPGTTVLRNRLGYTDPQTLAQAEALIAVTRMAELAANPIDGHFDFAHLQAIHRHLLGDLYEWAPVASEILDERFVTVVVDVDAAVDVGEHSIEFTGDGGAWVTQDAEIAWRSVDCADFTSHSPDIGSTTLKTDLSVGKQIVYGGGTKHLCVSRA